MRREIVLVIGRDHLGVPLVKEGKSTTRRADIDRLPKAIEHQNLTVKWRVQRFLRAPNELSRSNWRDIITRNFRCQRNDWVTE